MFLEVKMERFCRSNNFTSTFFVSSRRLERLYYNNLHRFLKPPDKKLFPYWLANFWSGGDWWYRVVDS